MYNMYDRAPRSSTFLPTIAGAAMLSLLVIALLLFAGQGTAAASSPLQSGNDTVTVADSSLGKILVGKDGMSLYMFDKDTADKSNCYGQCAVKWPPLLVDAGVTPTAGEGVTAKLGVTERTDGAYQVTANGMPLYYWYEDKAAGDVKGQAVGDVWWVLAPDGTVIRTAPAKAGAAAAPEAKPAATEAVTATEAVAATEATTATEAATMTEAAKPAATEAASGAAAGAPVTVADSSLGKILVGKDGLSLYMFDKDTADKSNCYGQCAVKWPPLLIEDGAKPVGGEGVTAKLGVTERTDGTYQVTANGMPLYYWYEDKAAGDVKGQAVGDVWWVLAPDGTVIRTAPAKAGAAAAPEAKPAATEAAAPTQMPVTGGDGALSALLAGLGVLAGGGWVMLRNLRR